MKLSIKSLIILVLFSCGSNSQKAHFITLPHEWPIEDSVSTKFKQRFQNGYVEFFSVNSTDFRFLRSKENARTYDLQTRENGNWITNLNLTMPRYTLNVNQDVDLDRYYDLTFLEGGNIRIYFFDASKKCFDSKPLEFAYDCALLDSSKLIYGANDHEMGSWNVDIFSIRHRSKTHFYKVKLALKSNTNNGSFRITKARVYKTNTAGTDTTLASVLNIDKDFSEFSLLHFMKELVGNRMDSIGIGK